MSADLYRFTTALLIGLILSGCMTLSHEQIELSPFEKMVASRMMISLGYFCDDIPEQQKYCQEAKTQIHPEVIALIRDTEIAGVILFASNFKSVEQGVQLTYGLQNARPNPDLPLLIAVDQEGGRVARLPRHVATSFTGNMAIGATYEQYNTHYAEKVGTVLGAELSAMGINVNFAPTLDVNSNPDNPVINVRSFGENPDSVADLGVAMVNAMQNEGVAVALKHFPGHGDTEVDSHTGLPRIERSIEQLRDSDLVPFRRVISEANPAMVMTAHIQYPQIDSHELVGVDGEPLIAPATMSHKILNDLLREELAFDGVIVTDALDMAGISDYFEPVRAVVETFTAGADLALMPFKIDRVEDVAEFKRFVKLVAHELQQSDYDMAQMDEAVARMSQLRTTLPVKEMTLDRAISGARQVVGNQQHKQIEWQLANRAITLLHNHDVLPLHNDVVSKIELIVDDSVQSELLRTALLRYWSLKNDGLVDIATTYWSDVSPDILVQNQGAVRLAIVDYGYRSRVVDDEAGFEQLSREQKRAKLEALLEATTADDKVVLIAMQSPYDLIDSVDRASAAVATYHSVIIKDPQTGAYQGISFDALAAMLTGVSHHYGSMPVTLAHGSDYKNKE